jgi:hypothetical protein
MMIKKALVLIALLGGASGVWADEASVHVEATSLQGPRPLAKQTESAVVRDYLEAWQAMSGALAQNRAEMLDTDFVGDAREKLGDTVQQQAALGIETQYKATSHDIRIVFYSPEGLSVQLVDNVDYDVRISDHDKMQAQQHLHARYVVVLTPAEVRWRVRVFQASPE